MPSPAVTELERLTIGQEVSCELVVNDVEIQAVARLTGDVNPLHLDESVARQRGFAGRVAHGLLALGMLSRLIGTQLPGPGALWIQQTVQFVEPVYLGDHLEARVTIRQLSPATGMVVLATDVVKLGSGAVVLRGTATVRIPGIDAEGTS